MLLKWELHKTRKLEGRACDYYVSIERFGILEAYRARMCNIYGSPLYVTHEYTTVREAVKEARAWLGV